MHQVSEQQDIRSEFGLIPRHFELLVESLNDAICVIDYEGRVLFFNQAFRKLFTRLYAFEPFSGMYFLDPFLEDSTQYHHIQRSWTRARSGETFRQVHELFEKGKICCLELSFKPLRDEVNPSRVICVIRDITDQKKAERKLQIYKKVLVQTKKRLDRRRRELEGFTYAASHDLQEPLRKIRVFTDLLRTQHLEELDEEAREFLSRMDEAARRMSIMRRDLLTFSRISSRGGARRLVDLNEVLATVQKKFSKQIRETGASIETERLCQVKADPAQMQQLFKHLIDNALKFRRESVAPRIWITSRIKDSDLGKKSKTCVISVQDNGIGFDAQYADQIFLPFERLHRKGKHDGSGMGLAICQRIVERHNGFITTESTPGEGSRFIIRLPAPKSENAR